MNLYRMQLAGVVAGPWTEVVIADTAAQAQAQAQARHPRALVLRTEVNRWGTWAPVATAPARPAHAYPSAFHR